MKSVNVEKAKYFKDIVEGCRLLDKNKTLRFLTWPLCKIIYHLKTRVSWIFPLFKASYEHINWWINNSTLVQEFDGNSRSKVLELFDCRWNRKGYLMWLRKKWRICICVCFDPYYTPAEFSNIILSLKYLGFLSSHSF